MNDKLRLWILCRQFVFFLCVLCRVKMSVVARQVYFSAEPTCVVVQTTITCTGEGTLTETIVRQAGVYTQYQTAYIKSGITAIGDRAFRSCSALVQVEIADTVTSVGSIAFEGFGASSIVFPGDLTFLSNTACNACGNLVSISMSHQNGLYKSSDGMIFKEGNLYMVGMKKNSGLTFNLPNVPKILDNAVRWNQAVTMVVHDNCEYIGSHSFYACKKMTTLKLGLKMQTLHQDALTSCTALTAITVHANNSYFYHNSTTTGSLFGKKIAGTDYAESVVWVSVTSTAITIPKTATAIGSTALQSCPDLTKVTIESGSTKYKMGCGNKVVLDNWNNGKNNYARALYCIGSATTVTIDSTVTYLESTCFRGCKKLVSVYLHSGVNRLGGDLFRDCSELTTIDFAGCTMCDTAGTTAIMSSHMFVSCSKLNNVVRWPSNVFRLGYVCLIGTGLTTFNPGRIISASDERALQSCSKLQTVVIPNTMHTIGAQTFSYCSELTSLTFESGSTLTTVSSLAFGYCTKLPTVTLPTTITNLVASCFGADTALTSIKFASDAGLYRSDGVAAYQILRNADGSLARKYHTFLICPPGLKTITLQPDTRIIGTHAFYGCNNLLHVQMNDWVERVEQSAFIECAIITYARLPAHVKFIGARAFDSCAKLRNILYCNNNNNVDYEGDPFPSNPNIYLFHDFPGGTFCGHPVQPILDHECNIPTDYFTHDMGIYQCRINVLLWISTYAYIITS